MIDLGTTRDELRSHFSDRDGVKWLTIFAWQCPLMFLSYALLLYVTGLTSYIVSPVARKGIWDSDAKVHHAGREAQSPARSAKSQILSCRRHWYSIL